MSVTYPTDPTKPYGDPIEAPDAVPAHEEAFVPVYARRGKARGGQGKVRTWMILVPVGVLTLGGIGAMMAMNGGDEVSAPLAEPAATLPVLSTTPVPLEPAVAPLNNASTPAPVVAAPPVREAAPTPRAAPAPVRRSVVPAPAPTATPRTQTPAPAATGPQPYAPAPAGPSTTTLNTAPAVPVATPAPAPRVIIVEPVG